MTSRLTAVAALIVGTALLGCSPAVAPTADGSPATVLPAAPSSSVAAEPPHLVLAREAAHLMEAVGDEAWPGLADARPSIIVTSPDRSWLLGAAPVGARWTPAGPGEWVGPPVPGLSPGVQMLDEQPAAVAPPLDDLQQIIDAALGDERFTLDATRYIRFVVHEAFHAYQIEMMAGELPGFGLRAAERELLDALGGPDVTSGVAAEARLLARGLRQEGEAAALAAAGEFLRLRGERRADLSADAAALERSLEWTEGLARYADVGLMEAASGDYPPTHAFAEQWAYPRSGSAERELLGWLDDITSVPGTVRDRYYELGAGQASLLDRLMPEWHWRAMPSGESLESLLAMAVERADSGLAPSLRALEQRRISVGTATGRSA